MKGFNFEKNLNHQTRAVESVISALENVSIEQPKQIHKNYINPVFDLNDNGSYRRNVRKLKTENSINQLVFKGGNIIDIMMETGTGKTYTYTKTIFELNRNYGIFKFIVVVPTLSIKAGTVNFLKSSSSREHFKEQYNKTIQLHIVESNKKKNKKSFIPPAVSSFVNAGTYEKNSIQVLLINAGMINSETMKKSFDKGLFDEHTVPFNAISATQPFMIMDEPHKFSQGNKTWANIQQMKPQIILRYGATFKEYENLIYNLTAVNAFNRNLVKGVIGHITEFESGKNAIVRFVSSDGTEARLELTEKNKKKSKTEKETVNQTKTIAVVKKDSLQKVHPAMQDLFVENINKSTLVLSNGLQLKKGDKINPYSYAEKLQEIMIQKAIQQHFKTEKELLTRNVKIKPITLFFIDNIEEYRGKNGYVRNLVEQYIKAEVTALLKTEKHP